MSVRRTTTIALCLSLVVGLTATPAASAEPPGPTPARNGVALDAVDAPSDPAPTPTPTPTPTAAPSPVPEAPAPDAEAVDTDAGQEPSEAVESDAAAAAASLPAAGRIGGDDLYARSILASRAAFPGGADTVIVANGAGHAGPIIAAGLAATYDAPLLYARPSSASSAAVTEMRRLSPSRILVVGLDDDVNRSLLTQLQQIAPVERVLFSSRSAASRAALQRVDSAPVVWVTGEDLTPYAAATAAAATQGGASLMVGGSAPAAGSGTLAALARVGARQVVILGGTGDVSSGYARSLSSAGYAVTRVTGSDIYALSLAAAQRAPGPVSRVFAANPDVVVDVALAASLAGSTSQPMVVTPYQCMLTVIAEHIDGLGAEVVGVGKSNWLRDAAVRNVPCAEEKPRREAALESAIRSAASRYSGRYAVTVRELGRLAETGRSSLSGSMLEPASAIKVFAAWAALKRVQDGRATMSTKPGNTTLGACLKVMIHNSDNYCHTDIVHWIGISNLNRMIADAGFSRTRYGSVPRGTSVLYAGNRTTTDDLSRFLRLLESGQLLEDKYADVLKHHMRYQLGRSRIASGIPPGVVQVSKPGALWIASGLLQADSGIVYGPQATFTISIIGIDGPEKAALRAITRAAYTHFNGSFGTAASFPVKQMETVTRAGLRSSAAGPVVRYVSTGTAFEVGDSQRAWYQVHYGSQLLWIDYRLMRNRPAYRRETPDRSRIRRGAKAARRTAPGRTTGRSPRP